MRIQDGVAVCRLPEGPVVALQPLREFEILLIICAIVFLALLLLGIGCSYYCLKKRNIRVIRRRPVSTIGSEVTRISDPPSMFEGLKIPRAHATDTSGERRSCARKSANLKLVLNLLEKQLMQPCRFRVF
jgi:hypothetical protein